MCSLGCLLGGYFNQDHGPDREAYDHKVRLLKVDTVKHKFGEFGFPSIRLSDMLSGDSS